jgi:hypothetical protein
MQIANTRAPMDRRTVTGVALVLAALAIIVPVGWRFVGVAYHQLYFPFDLCFETPSLATIKVIKGGWNPYSPDVFNAMPFVLTMYTPLYHYLVAMLPIDATNPFFYGRWVSLICVVACGLLLFLVHRRGQGQWWMACVLPFLLFSSWPLMANAAFLKNDSLGLLFSAAAVATLSFATKGRGLIAAGLCILAVASKQSFVAAPTACLCFLVLQDRREAVRFVAMLTGLMISGAIAATWVWGHGFWFSVIGAVRQPFDVETGLRIILQAARQPLLAAILLGSAAALVHACVRRGLRVNLRESPYAFYLFFAWSVMLLTIWKRGASANYLFEFHLASVLWLSHWLRTEIEYRSPSYLLRFLLVVAGLTSFEIWVSRPAFYTFATAARADAMAQRSEILQRATRQTGVRNPKLLNLVTHVDAYLLSDQVYLNDPFLYGLLWEDDILSPQPIALAISRGAFDWIAVPPSFLEPGLLKDHEQLLRESLHHQYRFLASFPSFGYAIFIRRDFGVEAVPELERGFAHH